MAGELLLSLDDARAKIEAWRVVITRADPTVMKKEDLIEKMGDPETIDSVNHAGSFNCPARYLT